MNNIRDIYNELMNDIAILSKSDRFNSRRAIYAQLKAMLFLAKDRKYCNDCSTRIVANEENYLKDFKTNNYFQLFGKDVEHILETYMSFDDDCYPQAYKLLCEMENREAGTRYDSEITSDSVSEIIYRMANLGDNSKILDICSGQGFFLGESKQYLDNPEASGFDINAENAYFSERYLNLLNINNDIKCANVLSENINDKYDLVFGDYPINTMFAQIKESEDDFVKINPEKINPDWGFVYKAVNSINEKGKAFVLVQNGRLFRTNEKQFRKELVEKGLIEAIIQLPVGVKQNMNVAFSLLVLSKNNSNICFIDAFDKYELLPRREKKVQVNEVLKSWDSRLNDLPEKEVVYINKNTVADNDYDLDVSRYVKKGNLVSIKNPVQLSDLAEIIPGYQYTTRSLQELDNGLGSVGIIKVSNIVDDEIDYSTAVSADLDVNKIDKYILKKGDIVVATKGTLVKSAIYDKEDNYPYLAQSNTTIIRPKNMDSYYLVSYLNSKYGREELAKLQKGMGIQSIPTKDLAAMCIPTPDELRQYSIGSDYRRLKQQKAELLRQVEEINNKLSSICNSEVDE